MSVGGIARLKSDRASTWFDATVVKLAAAVDDRCLAAYCTTCTKQFLSLQLVAPAASKHRGPEGGNALMTKHQLVE
jgi:hypothetical protein